MQTVTKDQIKDFIDRYELRMIGTSGRQYHGNLDEARRTRLEIGEAEVVQSIYRGGKLIDRIDYVIEGKEAQARSPRQRLIDEALTKTDGLWNWHCGACDDEDDHDEGGWTRKAEALADYRDHLDHDCE